MSKYEFEAIKIDKYWRYRIGDDPRLLDKHEAAKIIGISSHLLSQTTQKYKGAEAFDKKMRKISWLLRNGFPAKAKVFEFGDIFITAVQVARVAGITQSAASYRLRSAQKQGFDLAFVFGDRDFEKRRRHRKLDKIPSPSRFERVFLSKAGENGVYGRASGDVHKDPTGGGAYNGLL